MLRSLAALQLQLIQACSFAIPAKSQVEGAVKRAPLEERKKRKQEGAAGPAQLGPAAAAAAGAEPEAQPPAAKKPRPARSAPAAPRNAAAAEGKHKWVRAVAVGGLTPEAVDGAVQMARAAGEVGGGGGGRCS